VLIGLISADYVNEVQIGLMMLVGFIRF